MSEQVSQREAYELPSVTHEERTGEFWRAAYAQAASEKHSDVNEDVVSMNEAVGLFSLSDGMGGAKRPREAAEDVTSSVDLYLSTQEYAIPNGELSRTCREYMIEAIQFARAHLWKTREKKSTDEKRESEADAKKPPMDATITSVLVRRLTNGEVLAVVGYVGDCRAYLMTDDGEVTQITDEDDVMSTDAGAQVILPDVSLGELEVEKMRVRRELSEATSKSELSQHGRALLKWRHITTGVGDENMKVHVEVLRFPEHARIAIMSDGVYENLGDARTAELLSQTKIINPADLARLMTMEAQKNAHEQPSHIITAKKDDVTVCIIERT